MDPIVAFIYALLRAIYLECHTFLLVMDGQSMWSTKKRSPKTKNSSTPCTIKNYIAWNTNNRVTIQISKKSKTLLTPKHHPKTLFMKPESTFLGSFDDRCCEGKQSRLIIKIFWWSWKSSNAFVCIRMRLVTHLPPARPKIISREIRFVWRHELDHFQPWLRSTWLNIA